MSFGDRQLIRSIVRTVRDPAEGRFVVSQREAIAAARARVAADRLRGAVTDPRVIELAAKRAG